MIDYSEFHDYSCLHGDMGLSIMFGSCLHNSRVVLYISMPMMMGMHGFYVKHNTLVFSYIEFANGTTGALCFDFCTC